MPVQKIAILLLQLLLPLLLFGQTLCIQQGKKKIKILPGARLDVLTKNERRDFTADSSAAEFLVKNISADSITLYRPVEWKDTFSYKFNAWTGKDIPEKKRYYKVAIRFEQKQFSLAEITQIKYTYQSDQSGDGCIGCLLIPGLNIYYLLSKRHKTRVFDMTRWKFVWQ